MSTNPNVSTQMVLAIEAGVRYKNSQYKVSHIISNETLKLYKVYIGLMDKLSEEDRVIVRDLLNAQFKNVKH